MFKEMIEQERVTFADSAADWQEAIKQSAQPLVAEGAIEEEYIKAMIECVEEHGPYIVIAPNIAIPHAKKAEAVHETAISLLKLDQPVYFSDQDKHKAKLIFTLASADNESHLSLLQNMVDALSDEETVGRLLEANGVEDLKEIFGL